MADDEASVGLRAPAGPVLPALSVRRRWSAGRLAWQALGALAGIGLLAWAVRLSMSEGNARSLGAMRAAPAGEVALLAGLTAAGLALNGLMFWVTLRAVRRVPVVETVLINAMATFLSVLPLKLGLAARVLVHHRRHGVPMRVLVGWVAAMGALGLSVLGPLVVAGLWRGAIDAWWWAVAGGGMAAGSVLAVVLGRLAGRVRWLRVAGLGSHEIVRHPGAVLAHLGLRVADAGVLTGRFMTAAAMADVPMPAERAVLLSTTYFLLSVVTPAGTLGFREMGVAALGLASGADESGVALVALIVTGAELVVSGAGALVGMAVVRPDRLVARAALTGR